MNRSEIRVGDIYGVRLRTAEHATVVPAKVVGLDESYPYRLGKYGAESSEMRNGGVKVVFMEPTRKCSVDFNLAKSTNDYAGPVIEDYVFGDKRNKAGVGKHFVGLWSELEARRKAVKKYEREAKDKSQRDADEFAPVLDAYIEKLKSVGIEVAPYADGSGLHSTDYRNTTTIYLTPAGDEVATRTRAKGFKSWEDVRLEKSLFDQLIDIAIKHGERLNAGAGDDD